MKLYYTPGACSLAVRIVINEIGIDCEYEAVDLKTKRTENNKNFLEVNPKGAVPTLLLDDGEVLTENAVIQQYLADTYKATQLLPPLNNFKRYRVLEWLNYVSTEMHKGVGILFNPSLDAATKDQIFIPLIKKKLDFLNNHFQKNDYLMGKDFTLPDAYLMVILNWLPNFKFNLKDWPQVANYFERLKARPAVKKSLEQEKLTVTA